MALYKKYVKIYAFGVLLLNPFTVWLLSIKLGFEIRGIWYSRIVFEGYTLLSMYSLVYITDFQKVVEESKNR